MKRFSKVLVLVLVLSMLIPQFTVVEASKSNETERVFGKSRIETAIEVSKKAYEGKVDTLFIAGFSGEADALSSSFLLGKKQAPLLLTYKDRLDPKLLTEIQRLDPKEIIILGGESVVNKNVENALSSKGYNTRRISGASRIQTAVNVALDHYKYIDVPEVFVVEFDSLVDALAIGPVAAKSGIPVLLTLKDRVPEEVSKFLKDHKVKKVTIIGGNSNVSDKGRAELLKSVASVDRIHGSNRAETSLKIADKYFKNLNSIFISNGSQFADALIGGYFAGMNDGPIILTEKNKINFDVLKFLSVNKVKTFVLGGSTVVSDFVYKMIENRGQPVTEQPVKAPVKPPVKAPVKTPPVDTAPSTSGVSAIEKEVVRLTNIERGKNGLSAFTIGNKLSEVARLKSEDMQVNNYFDHTSPKYGSPFDMMKKFGIKYSAAGENIAKGQRTPEAVVKAWMNSPGHRANILNKSFNTIGVGAHEYKGTMYWTQMFTN